MGEPSETGSHGVGSALSEEAAGANTGVSNDGAASKASTTSNGGSNQSGRSKGKAKSDAADDKRTQQSVANAADKAVGKAVSAAPAEGNAQPSAKELKLKKQAEKQARRAQEKAARESNGPMAGSSQSAPQGSVRVSQGPSSADASGRRAPAQPSQGQHQSQAQHRRTGSQSQAQRPLVLRRRGSQNAPKPAPKPPSKEVGLFGHLYGAPRRVTLDGVNKEVHPAVLSLGFQLSNYTICGSNARCVAMLLAFKTAIRSYTTPPTTSLARHLTSHYLSPQIEYLISHRPLSVSMGNAIRWLKDYIIHFDPDTPEMVAKDDICEAIDTFIRERITVADTAIANSAKAKIRNGTKVVTYAKSSIVEQTLVAAHDEGKSFSVTVLDSRPLFEGQNLVKRLVAAGIEAKYALLPAASHVLREADLVLLGAHAMMANGRLYSRVGTACVAMIAKGLDVPVIALAESLKFTDRVALDSIVLNEVAPPEELVITQAEPVRKADVAATATDRDAKDKGKKGKKDEAEEKTESSGLQGWRDKQGLQLLNILYDITPAEYVDMVITEYGSLPPSSVPVVFRISTEKDVRI